MGRTTGLVQELSALLHRGLNMTLPLGQHLAMLNESLYKVSGVAST